ncbi:MAG: hypothetical protein IJV37_06430 [Bacteroidales bacterium]|nr:hypothetical protein [Bacteroidales bacterium]
MGGKIQKRLILCAVALLPVLSLSAQSATGQTDSLVRLLNARYLEQVETNGRMARKAIDATFLHNGTYLSSDSALWHVEDKVINFYGNVQLVQGESVLTSDLLDYLIDENLAQFRGSMVQLRNKQDNILRTRILDYNTADSLAVFQGGASMMSEDGQIIESDDGIYSNARNLFTFTGNVNMFTDSVFVRTDQLLYDSDAARADFLTEIDFWKDGRMLSAGMGWYRRNEETFFFRRKVHGLGETQESWSDSLYYYRRPNDILMLGNIQIQDQSRKVAAMGDRLQYVDSLSLVTLEKRASAALWDGEGEHADTTYLGATRFTYHTVRRCDVPEEEVKTAAGRLDEMLGDPIAEYRRRAAEQAAQAAAEALKDDPNAGPQTRPKPTAPENPASPGPEDRPSGLDPEPPAARDSLALRDSSATAGMTPDSLQRAARDSLAVQEPVDTSKIGFLLALGDVRIFRKDMQVRCDSLRYSDLDSIARLYKDPIVWNETRRQYNSDSLFVLIRDNKMERANLLSNAFIHTEEKEGYFDQIKSTDVIAYFSDSTSLRRFDALGGVTALLYLEENDAIATVNKTESQMMMALFNGQGEVDYVYNFDHPKSDAYPVVQLPAAEHKLRGFNWQPDRRPKDKYDVTSMVVKDSERAAYEARPKAEFRQTDRYFPGHMKDVYAALDAARQRPRQQEPAAPMTGEGSPAPPLSLPDSLRHSGLDPESPARDSLALRDSSATAGMTAGVAGMTPGADPEVSPRDTTYMSEKELRRALRTARRDARWAELDARDADKAAKKEARKAARQARRAARIAAREARQAEIDAAKLQKYIERYQQKQKRNEGRKQEPIPAGERPPGTEAGGELPPAAESE